MARRALRLRSIGLASFLKLNAAIGAAVGLLLALLNPLGSLVGFEARAGIESPALQGPIAWLVYLVLLPLVLGLFGAILGLLAYVPFVALLRGLGGLKLQIEEHTIRGD